MLKVKCYNLIFDINANIKQFILYEITNLLSDIRKYFNFLNPIYKNLFWSTLIFIELSNIDKL